jgi:hypothetical protein
MRKELAETIAEMLWNYANELKADAESSKAYGERDGAACTILESRRVIKAIRDMQKENAND